METISLSEARANLFKLVERVSQSHRPVHLHGRHNDAVLLSAEDFRAIQETLYVMNVPGLYEDLLTGLKEPIEECIPDSDLKW